VEDGVHGILVPVRSPARIRKAVRRLAADDRLYASMCANALAFAEKFSEQAIVGGILVPRVARALR
jgi:glycosyltransferase involved in cell wall biosynthesis